MLSVSTAAVPQAMRPSVTNASPSPPTLGRKDRRSWNCEYTFPKRRCRPSAARKKIIAIGQDEATIGIDVHCQTVSFESNASDENSHDSYNEYGDDNTSKETTSLSSDCVDDDENPSRSIPFVKSAHMQRVKVVRPRDDDSFDRDNDDRDKSRKNFETVDKEDSDEKKFATDVPMIADSNENKFAITENFAEPKRLKLDIIEHPMIDETSSHNSSNLPMLGARMPQALELLARWCDEKVGDIVNNGTPGIPGEKCSRNSVENFTPSIKDNNGWDADAELAMLQNPDTDYRDDCFATNGTTVETDEPYFMIGFPNPPGENRCWLNATLHAMFALPLFDQPEQLDSDQLRGCSQLTKTLMALRLFWGKGAEHKQKTYQTVKLFKESMGILDESYPSQRQQDVSEFLTMFLNYLKTDFEKLSSVVAEGNIEETENIPENVQDGRATSRSPQTPTKRSPLAEISPGKRKIVEIGDSSGPVSPKSRKNGLTYSPQDLLSPRVNRILSKPTDPSYVVHTPPHRPDSARQQQTKENSDFSKNPIDRYFLLHMMEHYSCEGCSKHRQRKVDNLMLYVDLPPETENRTVTLDEAIKTSLKPEERILTCAKCKYDKHNVFTTFRSCPKILMVQVNRYGMCEDGSVAKFNTPVEIPEILQLELGTPDPETGFSLTENFEPVSVIAHVGSAMDCGHYTSYVRRGDDSWYHYNDLSVTPMSRYEALAAAQTTAYVVFFVSSKI